MILELKVKVFRLKYLDKEKLVAAESEEQISPRYLRGVLRIDVVGDAVIPEVYRNFVNKRIRKCLRDVESENADLAMQHGSDKNSILALTLDNDGLIKERTDVINRLRKFFGEVEIAKYCPCRKSDELGYAVRVGSLECRTCPNHVFEFSGYRTVFCAGLNKCRK